MGRNSASPDHLSSGDDNAGGKVGLGFRSIRDRIRFKKNPNPANISGGKVTPAAPDRQQQWRAGRSHLHRSAARKFSLFAFRGRSWFYFCIFFAVFVFALASMVLQSSITSLFTQGGERGRSVREGLKFGSSLEFVPWRSAERGVLDRLRSEPRIGVRPPRLGLVSVTNLNFVNLL